MDLAGGPNSAVRPLVLYEGRSLTKTGYVLGALVAAGILGGGWWHFGASAEDDAPLQTVAVERGDLETSVTALGKVEPLRYVDVGAQISGQVETLAVDLGDRVAEGDLLAVIDPTVYEAQVAGNRATLKGLEAQVAEQRARLTLAQQRHTRNQELYKAKAVAREDVDTSAAEAVAAEARLAVLEAEIEKVLSTLQADEANLGYTRITAPMAGTVMSLEVRQGQTISARQATPVLMRIADLDTMTVKAQVSEADVGKLILGMDAWFTTLGEPDRRWQGRLRQILPTPEVVNDVVLYNALFDVTNADRRLMPQMTAQVFFVLGRVEDAPLIPVAALQGPPGAQNVRVQVNDVVEDRPVTVGLQDRVKAAIVDGLEPGEQVILPQASGGVRRGRT